MPLLERSVFGSVTVNNTAPHVEAALLVACGGAYPGASADVVRLAARIQAQGVAAVASAAVLEGGRPTLAEALDQCAAVAPANVVVLPYFLTFSQRERAALAQQLAIWSAAHPSIPLCTAPALGAHPGVAKLVAQRALEADYLHAHPDLSHNELSGPQWQPLHTKHSTALLLVAPDESDPSATATAQRLRAATPYAAVETAFLANSEVSIADTLRALLAQGVRYCIAVPFFLHPDPLLDAELRARCAVVRAQHPDLALLLAKHLSYDRLLLAAVAERLREAR